MSRHGVGSALEAMQDDNARERLAAGDFEPAELGELDEHEQEQVRRAAIGYPEVLPFFTLVEAHGQGALASTLLPAVQMQDDWSSAFNYALGTTGDQLDDQLAPS
jgi:hypothetical protein